MPNHDVELDEAGFNSRRRITCHDCNVTIIRQPYMTTAAWVEIVTRFDGQHPSSTVEDYLIALERARHGAL